MLLRLAIKDFIFDKLMSFCVIFSICAVIAPLLLLFSLRFGILQNLERNLTENPINLEIKIDGNYNLDKKFFDDIKQCENVGFVVPLTRSLSVQANLRAHKKPLKNAILTPTAIGDPIVKYSKLHDLTNDNEVFISKSIQNKLNLTIGDNLDIIVPRNNAQQNGIASFKVAGVLSDKVISNDTVYVTSKVLIATEDYRMGYEPEFFSDGSKLNSEREYLAKARIFAKSLDDVAYVVKFLNDRNITNRSKLYEINNIKNITFVLNFIFEVIASIAIVGGIFSYIGLILSSLIKKTKAFALMRLMGFSKWQINLLIVFEAIIADTLGFILSLILYYLGSATFNKFFANLLTESNVVSTLSFSHILIFYATSFVFATVIALLCAKYKFMKAQISDILREVN